MKTNAISRIYAFAISALFATVATVGVAVMMTASGEHARMEVSASAATPAAQPATPQFTQWRSPAPESRQAM